MKQLVTLAMVFGAFLVCGSLFAQKCACSHGNKAEKKVEKKVEAKADASAQKDVVVKPKYEKCPKTGKYFSICPKTGAKTEVDEETAKKIKAGELELTCPKTGKCYKEGQKECKKETEEKAK